MCHAIASIHMCGVAALDEQKGLGGAELDIMRYPGERPDHLRIEQQMLFRKEWHKLTPTQRTSILAGSVLHCPPTINLHPHPNARSPIEHRDPSIDAACHTRLPTMPYSPAMRLSFALCLPCLVLVATCAHSN